ncbi:hypothetical protein LMG24238_07120 [Paraburkholderia sediminicola]|uniref:Uncharacterized protein n=1 Tax=Paraburkholderia sediminicola TaxID=458836 RepID=A0A6J5CRF2_9BURK|nr:hypothetical protein LMG24238_07120 [Paraburkholderia sediminicola]
MCELMLLEHVGLREMLRLCTDGRVLLGSFSRKQKLRSRLRSSSKTPPRTFMSCRLSKPPQASSIFGPYVEVRG